MVIFGPLSRPDVSESLVTKPWGIGGVVPGGGPNDSDENDSVVSGCEFVWQLDPARLHAS
jgi:hypothetical protein